MRKTLEEKVLRGNTEFVDGTGKKEMGLCLCLREKSDCEQTHTV